MPEIPFLQRQVYMLGSQLDDVEPCGSQTRLYGKKKVKAKSSRPIQSLTSKDFEDESGTV